MKRMVPIVMVLLVLLLSACGSRQSTLIRSDPTTTTEEPDTVYWEIKDDTTDPSAQPVTQPTTQQSKYPTLPTEGTTEEISGQYLYSTDSVVDKFPKKIDRDDNSYLIDWAGDYFFLGEIIGNGSSELFTYNVREGDLIEITAGPKDVSHLEIPKAIDGKTVAFIGTCAFRGCMAQDIVVPDTVLVIGENAFENSKHLKTVQLSNNLKAICAYGFSSCKNLTECTIPESVEALGLRAFEYCENYSSSIHLSEKCKVIGTECFHGCTSIREITLSEGLIEVCNSAFQGTRIKACFFPQSVKECGPAVFAECSELETVEFPKEVRPEATLSSGMFGECSKLKKVVLPQNIVGILEGAFSKCISLTEIHIPKTVELIDYTVFDQCSNLKDVYFENANCSIAYDAFRGDAGTVIHAPSGGSIQRYCALNPFLRFSAN